MSETIIKNAKSMIWKKKPFPTRDYLLACLVEELQEMNKTLVDINNKLKQ